MAKLLIIFLFMASTTSLFGDTVRYCSLTKCPPQLDEMGKNNDGVCVDLSGG